LRPGLLISAALVVPFLVSADTGGAVSATLYISGPVGGAAAFEKQGISFYGLPLPPIHVEQTVSLLNDADGDGLLDPGDTLTYTAEIVNLSSEPLDGLRYLVTFSPSLHPVTLSADWRRLEFGQLKALEAKLAPLPPNGKAQIYFVASFTGENANLASVFAQGLLYGNGFVLTADDPATPAVLDPAIAFVREVAGAAASLFPGPGAFTKEIFSRSRTIRTRIVSPGDTLEVLISYTSLGWDTEVDLLEFVPPMLQVVPGSIEPGRAKLVRRDGLTLIRCHFAGLSPGDKVFLNYRAKVSESAMFPFVATRAMAILPSGEVLFSDDPETAVQGDPTAVFFPWAPRDWAPRLEEAVSQWQNCVVPVIVHEEEGEEALRWALCSPQTVQPSGPADLMFVGSIKVPVGSLPEGTLFGILLSYVPSEVGKVYVPSVYGPPIFSPLSGEVGFVEELRAPSGEYIYIPLLVELPTRGPLHLTGVIVDEGV